MPVLPVTWISPVARQSARRFAAACSVGANSRSERASMAMRLPSSGQGRLRSPERRPASTWPTGMPQSRVAIAPAKALAVSPWTRTRSARWRWKWPHRWRCSASRSLGALRPRGSQPSSNRSANRPWKALLSPPCWPVRTTLWRSAGKAERARTTGASLIASGRVPTIETIRAAPSAAPPAAPSAATDAQLGGGALQPGPVGRVARESGEAGAERVAGPGGVVQHRLGSHQPDPAVRVLRVGLQPVLEALDHLLDHRVLLAGRDRRGGGDLLGAGAGNAARRC